MKTLYKILTNAFLTLGLVIGLGTTVIAADLESPANIIGDEVVIEDNFDLENWMVDLNIWNIAESSEVFRLELESDIEMESWMLEANQINWVISNEIDEEKEMKLESWMTEIDKW